MNISKQSWHYRMWMFLLNNSPVIKFHADELELRTWVEDNDDWTRGHWEYHPPKNLCQYVNRLPWFLFVSLLFFSFIALCVGILFVWPFMDLFLDLWYGQMFFGNLTIVAVIWLTLIVGLLLAFLHLVYIANGKKDTNVLYKAASIVGPTYELISTYISDRHNKICRKLEFKK